MCTTWTSRSPFLIKVILLDLFPRTRKLWTSSRSTSRYQTPNSYNMPPTPTQYTSTRSRKFNGRIPLQSRGFAPRKSRSQDVLLDIARRGGQRQHSPRAGMAWTDFSNFAFYASRLRHYRSRCLDNERNSISSRLNAQETTHLRRLSELLVAQHLLACSYVCVCVFADAAPPILPSFIVPCTGAPHFRVLRWNTSGSQLHRKSLLPRPCAPNHPVYHLHAKHPRYVRTRFRRR